MSTIEAPRTVYVMGRGQSGTTLLDVMLGYSPDVVNVGEVVSGLNRGVSELCSCGMSVGDCQFWSDVESTYSKGGNDLFEDASWLYDRSDIRRLPGLLFGRSRDSTQYQQLNDQLYLAVAHTVGRNVVSDSNKEFARAAEILRADDKSCAIHLVRSPRNVVASTYFRITEKGLPFKFMKREYFPKQSLPFVMVFLALTWNIGVVAAFLLSLRYRGRVKTVRYENLAESPASTFEDIGEFCAINVSPILQEIDGDREFFTKHSVGGNDLRESGVFKLVNNSGGRRKLPKSIEVLTSLATAPGRALLRITDGFC